MVTVTGTGGYIGGHLLKKLSDAGVTYQEVSRQCRHDITSQDSLLKLKPSQYVVHLAAKTFVPNSFEEPVSFYRFNFLATLNALELARKWDSRFILMSSYLYGPPLYIPVDEKHPLKPHNPYAETKRISEELTQAYDRDFGLKTDVLRLFNLYGPGQKGSLLIPEIMQQMASGKVILKDPRPKRDYIHVKDVCEAVLKLIQWKPTDRPSALFNLGTGTSHSVQELVSLIQDHAPNQFEVEFTGEERKGEVLDSVADMSAMKQAMGWTPQISLEEGIQSLFS